MGDDEFRYVKLETNEGVLAKRDLLSTQMNLLKLLRSIKSYHALRLNELKARTNLYNFFKQINQGIRSLQANIPKLTTSHSFEKNKESGKIQIKEKREAIRHGGDRDLEMQLRDIQEKLRALQ